MLERIKRLVRQSAFGSMVMRLRRIFFVQQGGALNPQNANYDQEIFEVMRRVLQSDSCCIDVGAHVGSILEGMIRLSPLGTHFAFEPLPQFAAHLRDTFASVRVYEAAVADHAGTAEFVHVENAPAYSGLRPRMYDRPDPDLKTITVNVVQLDEVIPNDQPIAFIKVDIEGGEFHALRGASRTVHRCRPVIVFEASQRSTGQYGVAPAEVYCFFNQQLGYEVSTMRRWLAKESPYDETGFCQNWHFGPDFFFIAYPAATEA